MTTLLDPKLLKAIYDPKLYADYAYGLASDEETGTKSIKHATEWCKEHRDQLTEIFTALSDEEKEHPFNKNVLGVPEQMTIDEWALMTYFIWEYNVQAQTVTDTMFADVANEIEDMINGVD